MQTVVPSVVLQLEGAAGIGMPGATALAAGCAGCDGKGYAVAGGGAAVTGAAALAAIGMVVMA